MDDEICNESHRLLASLFLVFVGAWSFKPPSLVALAWLDGVYYHGCGGFPALTPIDR